MPNNFFYIKEKIAPSKYKKLVTLEKDKNLFLSNHIKAAQFLGIIVTVVAIIGLLGWILDITRFTNLIPGLATMKFNTALCFILSGFSLFAFTISNEKINFKKASFFTALLTLTIAFLTLIQYIFSIDLNIDQLIIKDLNTPIDSFPGRMSPATAICFFFFGTALTLNNLKQTFQSQIFSFAVLSIALLSFTGYIYNISSLYNVFIFSSMALHTTTNFLMLSAGLFLATPDKGFMQAITNNTAGGIISRRLIPVAVIVPVAMGLIILELKKHIHYDTNFSIYLFVTTTIAILCLLIYITALNLYNSALERQTIIKQLVNMERKYRNIFENSIEGLFQINTSGKIFTLNPSMYQMLGYDNNEELMQHTQGFISNIFTSEKDYDRLIFKAKEHGIVENFETQLVCKDKTTLWVVINIHRITEESNLPYYQGTVINVTKRKLMENERKVLQLQLQQSQKMETIGRLAGGIAHDFNNLLVPIMGYAELGLMELENNKHGHEENFNLIIKAAERAARLVKQILAFSRHQILKMEILDLNEVINQFKPMLQRVLMEHIDLKIILNPDIAKIYADKGQMEQVIMNLVINAGDAMPKGGFIHIETTNIYLDEKYTSKYPDMKSGSYVMMAFSDTGEGISKEVQEKIFEPFYTTKASGKGTGLGLSTVYGIVKQHNGHIWLYSEIGIGTTFKIYLPKAKDENKSIAQSTKNKTEFYAHGTETVLVAEDEEIVRKLICETLEAFGYNVIESLTANNCLMLAEKYGSKIDILLTDIIMPEINGTDLYKKIQSKIPHIKVLYLSGYTETVITQQNFLKKENNFLQKPFTIKDLTRKVRVILDENK